MYKEMKVGSLVKIISTGASGNISNMNKMIGKIYRIKKQTSVGNYLVNKYYWDPRDLEPIIKAPKKEKSIFDIKDLVTGQLKGGPSTPSQAEPKEEEE